ncbi:hypothetical protein SAMN05216464_110241 [Mucilaginibacter pineti]|uniref:Uncharacterized protein n=1 Tax=Mucilaginibacter pineti TaxID=1391627 RepID=A0A1G7GQ74_9SPHI|nr:hypothetical protein [Mucilaginibacter pineti]SDE90139.1 hypothetical protein SAMN05216464_110241 [Mucilaginibacter pineti]
MDNFYSLLIIGSLIVLLILQFDIQQRRKVKKVLKQTNDVQPLLMIQSMNQKIDKINRALATSINSSKIETQLRKSTEDYNAGRIDMQLYNKHLNELVKRAEARREPAVAY